MDLVYSPYDPVTNADPFPVYARMRREAPLYHHPELDFWALSRHEDVAAALPDNKRFSSDHGPVMDDGVWGPAAHKQLSFVAMDPPSHTRMRAVVSRGFTPRRIAALEVRVRQIVNAHLDEALQKGTFDFAADFSARVPLDVISELMGVPTADRARLRREAGAMSGGVPDDVGIQRLLSLRDYYLSVIAERRAEPRDDLLSVLVGDDGLGDDEIIAFVFLLMGAGSETTTHLLNAAWYRAWQHPGQRALAFGGAVAEWAEESLRYDAPAQGTARRLTEPLDLYGEQVPQGAKMWLLIGSANRDETVFPEPDDYDLRRDTSKAIGFGAGRHYCLGGPLARLEARVAMEELVARVDPGYDVDERGIRRTNHSVVRGMVALPTTVRPR